MPEHDIEVVARRLAYDLTALQANVAELRRMIAALPLDVTDRPTCDHCGLTFPGPRKLAEHVYQLHNGPEPAHWLEAEAAADG